MNSELESFSKTIGLVYEAGLDASKWPLALQALCNDVGAGMAQMVYLDSQEYMISFSCSYGFTPFEQDIGAAHFRRLMFNDPVTQFGIAHPNEVFSDRRVIKPEVLQASGMQREIRQPANMDHILSVLLTDESADWTGFCFFRGKEQGPFSSQDEALITTYMEHLKRSTYFHKSIAGAANINILQNAVLDEIDAGIIIVDELHDVLICNKAAHQIIQNCGILRLNDSRLNCRNPQENILLHQSIDGALGEIDPSQQQRKIAVRLKNANTSDSILAVTTRFQTQSLEEKHQYLPISKSHYTARIPNRKNALITLCDPQDLKQNSVETLQSIFGLTAAEAALANSLANNNPLDKAAKQLGRTVGTARCQLQSIFEKTDTNRQSSLIRLLMAIP